jgi:4,5-dihydroxyphthalate decarboxylase
MRRLTIATARYDRTAPLHDGRVRPEGLDITWLPLNVEQIFWRQFRHLEFDASELSLSALLIRRGRGVDDLVPIPVFLSRTFRHSAIYVRAGSGIERPEDLVGRRVGVPEFQMTAAVWVRGILEDEYGVRQEDLHWFQGGLEQPGRQPQEPVAPPDTTIENLGPGKTLARMLEEGELDALLSPRTPSNYRPDGPVRRMFEDFWVAEREWYEKRRVFPIMHTVAIKRSILDEDPWIAQTLANAFGAAKRLADADLRETTALPIGLPFLVQHYTETVRLMGEDFWPYGVDVNRPTIETLIRYLHRQGLIPEAPAVDDLFPASTRIVSRV